MVNCFVCDKPYIKGYGICCSHQCHNKRINSRDRSNYSQVRAKQSRIEKYNADPKRCAKCQAALPWDKRYNKFCNHSCSASAINSSRDQLAYQKQTISLRTKIDKWPMTRVYFKTCRGCQKVFRSEKGLKYCNKDCKITSDIKIYRRACKFAITKSSHPGLFNSSLLQQHGWYRASNHPQGYNPHGATWDHLFRIEDGFKLKVPPSIMAHPANAQMISWTENFARKNSQITYDQLLQRIAEFDRRGKDLD